MSNFKLVDGKKVALSATEEQDLVDSATQHAIDMTAYDAQAYARKRQAEYPSIAELTIALYDTSDKEALVTKRNAVKLKYPKPS
jgi:hypothetical protein